MRIFTVSWTPAPPASEALAAQLVARGHTQVTTTRNTPTISPNTTSNPTAQVDPSARSSSPPPPATTTTAPGSGASNPDGSATSSTDRNVTGSCTVVRKVTSVRGSDPATGGTAGLGGPSSWEAEMRRGRFEVEIDWAGWVVLVIGVFLALGVIGSVGSGLSKAAEFVWEAIRLLAPLRAVPAGRSSPTAQAAAAAATTTTTGAATAVGAMTVAPKVAVPGGTPATGAAGRGLTPLQPWG
ncbi:hypothetical protein B0T24DRAFT_698400 [Lasiosphaeria ovina]|uniref:Uncharacterized protein n=1 Tax=Lasiosphaeria ovina TaxID=92902 RepID=A0AAE0KGR9_9PEZI|nr:hypothetical protein B0T24DRAFT_698400 [Lasiosphaeria ovina]